MKIKDTPLLSYSIKQKYKDNKFFGGVINSFNPPKLKDKFYFVLIRLPDEYVGHFTLIYNLEKDRCFYFNSFGLPPPPFIHKRMKDTKKNVIMNDFAYQPIDSSICGYLSMFIVDELLSGDTIEQVMSRELTKIENIHQEKKL